MTVKQLQNMAGVLWLIIGLSLIARGVMYFKKAIDLQGATATGIAIAAVIGGLIGLIKGKFVLSKAALRNKDRIAELPEPRRPWNVFALKFYPLILVMIAFGVGLRKFADNGLPGGWLTVGGVISGIGAALFVSAFAYWFEDFFRRKQATDAEPSAEGSQP